MLIVVEAWTFAPRRLFNASSKFEGKLRASLDLEVLEANEIPPKKSKLYLTTNLAEEQQTTAYVAGKPKGPASHLDQVRRPFS